MNYQEDILKHLRDVDCLPSSIRQASDSIFEIQEAVSRAAAEIEKLRKENEDLKKKLSLVHKKIRFCIAGKNHANS